MNLVFACRNFYSASGEPNAAFSRACLCAPKAGHRVWLVTDSVGEPGKDLVPRELQVVKTEPSLPHRQEHFFSENQEYSYRVFQTLRTLAARQHLDAIVFADHAAEGFATIRAKRLLNEFAGTTLVVRCHNSLSLLFQNQKPKVIYASLFCDFEMEDYCVRHGDVVAAACSEIAEHYRQRVGRKDISLWRDDPGSVLVSLSSGATARVWHTPAPKVSVIIPFYNQGQYLQEAVESVKSSQYDNLEIIVINDGSSDSSANEVFEGIGGVLKLRKTNGGLSSARNAGIRAASGEYLLMLDADDKIRPDYIRAAVSALENNPGLSYVTCHAQEFGVLDDAYIPVGYVPALMPFLNTDGKCANVFRRQAFQVCGGYDENLVSYEDWDLLLTFREHGLEGDVLPDEYFLYRRHFDSMVFTVAEPRRAELVQSLMLKHPRLVEPHAPVMSVMLAGLWQYEGRRRQTAEAEAKAEAGRQAALAQADFAAKMQAIRAEHIWPDNKPITAKDIHFLMTNYVRRKLRRTNSTRAPLPRPPDTSVA